MNEIEKLLNKPIKLGITTRKAPQHHNYASWYAEDYYIVKHPRKCYE